MLSSHCQHSALDVYALAASHAPNLHHLATYASSFLLSVEFPKITDEKVVTMGPIYLRQLYMLLSERTREFKQLLLPLPQFHAPTQQCDTKALKEAWRVAIADLVQCAAPDVQGAVIDSTKYSVINRVPLACDDCKASLEQRFEHLKHAWSLVKVIEIPVFFIFFNEGLRSFTPAAELDLTFTTGNVSRRVSKPSIRVLIGNIDYVSALSFCRRSMQHTHATCIRNTTVLIGRIFHSWV